MIEIGEEVLRLSGKAAKAFLEYDSREPTADEIQYGKDAVKFYLEHCEDE